MKRKFGGFVGIAALIGVVLFYLTYIGAFKASTFEAVTAYKRSAINAVVVKLQLPCDRLMNVGMGDYCRVFFEDGFSVQVAPVDGVEWNRAFPDNSLMSCNDGAAMYKQSLAQAEEWQKMAMERDYVKLRCILTSEAT